MSRPGALATRRAGILLHPTSLPGRWGIGDLGAEADAFLAWAAAAGQGVWQVLPLGPTHGDGSPYNALSTLAGNPWLISPERLVEEGLLGAAELPEPPRPTTARRVDFDLARSVKQELLRASWRHVQRQPPAGFRQAFEAFAAEAAAWLDDWALFAALRDRLGRRSWLDWDRELRTREPAALARARRELADEIAYRRHEQFAFFRQWRRVRERAHRLGVRILGDLPIYVAPDSADAWSRQELFRLDAEGRPEVVAGYPPDYFSATGQLWGNPLYRWDRLEEEGYRWWVERLRASLQLADRVRLDHFMGFVRYWEIPAGAAVATGGRWVEGPGEKLFAALRRELGELPLVAEDLGLITPEAERLRQRLGLPGMKVLQFAFGEVDSGHLPHRHGEQTVVYTGTHDNDTTRGWFAAAGPEERRRALDYLGGGGDEAIEWKLIRAAYTSVARLAVAPAQDLLGLPAEARMNTPGRTDGNWRWRLEPGQLAPQLAERLRRLAEVSGRLPASGCQPARRSS